MNLLSTNYLFGKVGCNINDTFKISFKYLYKLPPQKLTITNLLAYCQRRKYIFCIRTRLFLDYGVLLLIKGCFYLENYHF